MSAPAIEFKGVDIVFGKEAKRAVEMVDQGKSLLRITPTRWGTVSTGGFPLEVVARRS